MAGEPLRLKFESLTKSRNRLAELFKSINRDWWWIGVLFLAARLIYSVMGVLVLSNGDPISPFVGDPIFETHRITAPNWGVWTRLLVNGWFRWDTGWYLKIAALGYSATDGSIIFPPLFPFLTRLTASLLRGHYLLASLVVSNLACLVALILLFEFARRELNSRVGQWRTVIFFMIFPAAFFLYMGYSESLFLALALGAWLLARRGNWGWAGFFGMLATLTRFQGWTLSLALGWLLVVGQGGKEESPWGEVRRVVRELFSWKDWKELRKRVRLQDFFAVALPLLGFGGFLLGVQLFMLGNVSDAFRVYWDMNPVLPWSGAALFITRLFAGNLTFMDWVDLGLLILFLGLSLAGLPKLSPGLSLYLWASLGLMFMRGTPIHLLDSFSRYMLSLFPAFLVLAHFASVRWFQIILFSVFTLLQLIFVWLFLNWFWVA